MRMMILIAIIYQKDKLPRIIYKYENKAYWYPEKKQSRAHRKLIVKIDPITQKIVKIRAYTLQKKTL